MVAQIIDLLLFGAIAVFYLGTAYLEMPNKIDKKTKKKRTFYQRWKLAKWQLRAQIVLGIAAAFVALLAVLQLLRIVPLAS
ncbi:MAG: hypothetical protein PUG30_01095 [Actinomycetaceae bacterium]|nr:hypothetical protein [Actinomycetaceae bacterium]